MIGRRADGSPLDCSRRRHVCGSLARSAGWSGGWRAGSPGRERPLWEVGRARVKKGRSHNAFVSIKSRSSFVPIRPGFCFSPYVVGHLLLVAPLVAAADEEPDEEQQEQQEEDRANDSAHDHAHFVRS